VTVPEGSSETAFAVGLAGVVPLGMGVDADFSISVFLVPCDFCGGNSVTKIE
jgi:hypothetical protein